MSNLEARRAVESWDSTVQEGRKIWERSIPGEERSAGAVESSLMSG
jgi:hypothetical protein